MSNNFSLLNTKIIISYILQKEIDLAIYHMKKNDYNDNLVFKTIIKANNIVLLRKVIEDDLLDINKIKIKTFETIILQKNEEALIFLLRTIPKCFSFPIDNIFTLSCKKGNLDFVDLILSNKTFLVSDRAVFKGLLYTYISISKKKTDLVDYLKEYLINKGVQINFDIDNFKTFIPYLEKYNIFSYECLLYSIYSKNTYYLDFIFDNKDKIDFSLTFNRNLLLRRSMNFNNLNLTKKLLNEKEVLNSESIIKDIKKIKNLKNNDSIEFAYRTICLSKL